MFCLFRQLKWVSFLFSRSKVVSNQGRRTPPAKRRLVRKLPTLKWWQRRLIAWLRLYFPWLTRFMRFSPGTYIRWLQAKARKGQYSFDFI